MFKTWAEWKVKERAPESIEKTTLLAMATYADPDGWEVFMSEKTLAKHIGKSVRTIRRHIRALEARGEIVTFEQWYSGRKTNYYVITCAEADLTDREARKVSPEQQLMLPIPDVSLSQYEVVAEPTLDQRLALLGVFKKKRAGPATGKAFPEMADKMSAIGGQDDRHRRTRCPPTNPLPVNYQTNTELFEMKNTGEGSRRGLEILKETDPGFYEAMQKFSEGHSVSKVLADPDPGQARARARAEREAAYLAVAREKGFETVAEYRKWLALGPFAEAFEAGGVSEVGEGTDLASEGN